MSNGPHRVMLDSHGPKLSIYIGRKSRPYAIRWSSAAVGLGISALSSACLPATATAIESPDGRERYELSCPEGTSQCMYDAHDACGRGFVIDESRGEDYLETNSSGIAHVTSLGNSAFASSSGRSITKKRREVTMLITCKKR
jgi:hypothetical protein